MAIYKLGDIGEFKGGISKLDKTKYGKGEVFVNYMDVFKNFYIDSSLTNKLIKYNCTKNEHIKYELKNGDAIFTASSETPNEIAISTIYLSNENAIFNGFSKRYRFNHKILLPKYACYLFRNQNFRKQTKSFATGYTRFNISQKNLAKMQVEIPILNEQQKIIDIIEQNEKLFLEHNSCVRIDSIENVKNDMKNLIDIIEPLEKLQKVIQRMNNFIKEILVNKYKELTNNLINFTNVIQLTTIKYNNQNNYFATNAFGEMSINKEKLQIISQNNKPSRADLSPVFNSFIFSKLLGENKVFYFEKEPNFVVSTGFFNIRTNFNDHVLGFLLSDSFIKQKDIFSSGTTMIGISNNSLKNIKIKEPITKHNNYINLLAKNIEINNWLNEMRRNLIKILIK